MGICIQNGDEYHCWDGSSEMKMKIRYIVAGLLISLGCFIMYKYQFHWMSAYFIIAAGLITNWNSCVFRYEAVQWKSKRFFIDLSGILIFILIIILISRLPKELLKELLSSWYYIGALWLMSLSVLMRQYHEEKSRTR